MLWYILKSKWFYASFRFERHIVTTIVYRYLNRFLTRELVLYCTVLFIEKSLDCYSSLVYGHNCLYLKIQRIFHDLNR